MPTPTTVQARFQVRADTAANWTSANPTLLLNEIGIETDTKKLKMGDGTTAWASLAYFPSIVAGGTVLGNLEIGTTGTLTFEGSTADGFETTLAVVDPTADRTITLPNATGTVILNSGGQTIQFGAGAVGTPSITTVGDLDTGIWFPAANTTAISTGGSERLRIDSSGRLLAGTSSADLTHNASVGKVFIEGSGDISSSLVQTCWNASNASQAWLILAKSGGSSVGTRGIVEADESLGILAFEGDDGTNFIRAAAITARVDGTPGTNDMPGRLMFFTTADGAASPTERMRIDSSGRVGIGTTSPGMLLHAAGTIRAGASDTSDAVVQIGAGGTGNRNAYLDLVGDTTYTSYGLRVIRSNSGADASSRLLHRGTGNLDILAQEAAPIVFWTNTSEKARIDSSGRLLVGTSTSVSQFGIQPQIQSTGTSGAGGYLGLTVFNTTADSAPNLVLGHSKGGSVGTYTASIADDLMGEVSFTAANGTDMRRGASIAGYADGGWGTSDHPGRLVLSTTLDGASTPTEQLRITNDGVRGYNQAAPVAVNTTATLTVDNLKNGIITSTTAAAVTGTLPTGTLTEGGFNGLYTNFTFEWTVINTGATNNFTVAAGTAHTVVGNMVVAAGNSGRFATRRTAANTFVTYRLSS